MKPLVLDAEHVCNAHYLGHASAAAYADTPEDYASFPRLRLDRVLTFAGQDDWTRGFVAANEDALLVVFRGTDRPTDWITNVNYPASAGLRRQGPPWFRPGTGLGLGRSALWHSHTAGQASKDLDRRTQFGRGDGHAGRKAARSPL